MRRLGADGPLVSAVGLGCNNFSRLGTPTATQAGTTAVIAAALDAGVTLFDGADVYGEVPGRSEEFMGVALRGRRDDVVLATKFGHDTYDVYPDLDLGPKGGERYIRHAIEQSLRRLDTDRIDLYQMHTPDPATPIAETLGVLNALIYEGKVLHIGQTQFNAEQTAAADAAAREHGYVPFTSAQNEYSLLHRDPEAALLQACRERGIGFLPFFPLFNGLLTGKYTASSGEGRLSQRRPEVLAGADWVQLEAYRDLCEQADVSMLHASIGWLLAQSPVSSVIAGATRPEQVRANALSIELDADLAGRIGDLFGPR